MLKQGYFEGDKPFTFTNLDHLQHEAQQMHKEETEDAFFGGIKSTGEGWNGEYANGNNPNVETVFRKEYEQYYNKTYERKTTESK
jgi:hypothetical protein